MANHLIIGLGGTGGKVLRELRKRVYEEFRSNDPGNGVFLDYVYVDSSPADLEDVPAGMCWEKVSIWEWRRR